MTNETREALVLLKAQLAAADEAALRFSVLKETLQQSASGAGMAEPTAEAERSLSEVRALMRRQAELLESVQCATLADIIDREPNLRERMAAGRVLQAAALRHAELRELTASCGNLLQQSADFISYQLNVISGTAAEDTYGRSQPVAGPGAGVRREIAMFDADV
mgnify:FL=1